MPGLQETLNLIQGVGGGFLAGAFPEVVAAQAQQQSLALQQANLARNLAKDEASMQALARQQGGIQQFGSTLAPLFEGIGTPSSKAIADALRKDPVATFAMFGDNPIQGMNDILQRIEQERKASRESGIADDLSGLVNDPAFVGARPEERFRQLTAIGVKPEDAARINDNLQGGKNVVPDFKDLTARRNDLERDWREYRDSEDAYFGLKSTIEGEHTGPKDIASVFQFMKVLDPGSTVREGEFGVVVESAALGERVSGYLSRLLNGLKLGETQRSELLEAVQGIMLSKAQVQSAREEQERRFEQVVFGGNTQLVDLTMGGLGISDRAREEFFPGPVRDVRELSDEELAAAIAAARKEAE